MICPSEPFTFCISPFSYYWDTPPSLWVHNTDGLGSHSDCRALFTSVQIPSVLFFNFWKVFVTEGAELNLQKWLTESSFITQCKLVKASWNNSEKVKYSFILCDLKWAALFIAVLTDGYLFIWNVVVWESHASDICKICVTVLSKRPTVAPCWEIPMHILVYDKSCDGDHVFTSSVFFCQMLLLLLKYQ